MDKITLKPSSQELLFKNGEANTHYDVFVYEGVNTLEHLLGTLYIIAHIKYGDEDLSYVISLITSVAKREYYAEQSLQEQNPKTAFERTLRKLNEILEDFFETKDIKLNIGLAVITSDVMYVSYLGKFKVALARANEYVDILNTVQRTNDITDKFSNVISGRLRADDKIFAYCPTKSLTAMRERTLNNVFVKDGQAVFQEHIAGLAASVNNFACCGVHIAIDQLREASLTPAPVQTGAILATTSAGATPIASMASAHALNTKAVIDEPYKSAPRPQFSEQPKIIAADISVAKRRSLLTGITSGYRALSRISNMNNKNKMAVFGIIAVAVIIPVTAVIFFTSGPSGTIKTAYTQAGEKIKLAQAELAKSNERGARTLLMGALSQVAGIDNQKAVSVGQQAEAQLDTLDKISDQQPLVAFDFSALPSTSVTGIAMSDKGIVTTTLTAIGIASEQGISSPLAKNIVEKYIFGTKTGAVLFDGNALLNLYSAEKNKIWDSTLENMRTTTATALYGGNLYTLSDGIVYKYADAATGSVKRESWGPVEGNVTSITVDGNLYTLTKDGLLGVYFKGKKTGSLPLSLIPSEKSFLVPTPGSDSLYLADPTTKKIYAINKSSGAIVTAYKFTAINNIQSVAIASNGTIYVLASDNKIWELKP